MNRLQNFLQRLQSYGSLLCTEGDDACYTYADLWIEVQRWIDRFDRLNVAAGMVIGVRSDHSHTAIAVILALLVRRAIVALVPRDREVTGYVQDARLERLVDLGVDGSFECRFTAPSLDHPLLTQLRASGDAGLIIFSSGSTGRPKAALHSAERFLYKFRVPGRRYRTLAFMQFDHIAGLDTVFHTLGSGGTLIFTRRRDPKFVLELIGSRSVEVLPASPSFLRLLCISRGLVHLELSSLKVITYGSEVMDRSTLSALNILYPNVQIMQKYGTTETGAPRTVSRDSNSLWLKIKDEGVQIRVINDVLWIHSEGSVLGYLNAPSPFASDGWYCSGDLVDVDGEWIRFRGRQSEVINVGGEKVAPAEVEELILELDFVEAVVVFGDAHELMGQTVAARVVLAPGNVDAKNAVKTIRQYCRQRLAGYKTPIRIDVVTEGLSCYRYKTSRSH